MRRWIALLIALLIISSAACAEGEAWTCPNDGTANTGNFCMECGTPRPIVDRWTCPVCGTTGLTKAFCHECGSPRPVEADTASCEGEGFAGADDAVRAYIEAMNAGDTGSMLSTFAVETYVDHMDPAAGIARTKSFNQTMYYAVPVIGLLSRGILIERRRAEITQSIYFSWLFYAMLGTEYDALNTVPLRDGQDVDAFLSVLENAPQEGWVGRMRVTDVCGPDDARIAQYLPGSNTREKQQERMDRVRATTGADDIAERVAMLDVNGVAGMQFMTCVRYGQRWYNLRTMSDTAMLIGVDYMANGLIVGDMQ